ncbi:hypothetical protein D6D17_02433 [Aureobasidium pullulans]|nr:hypothetical protein D6D17_02433 [Aureobasidium pullulans]
MAHIISGIVQNVGGGIGLASEAYKAHKAKKTQSMDEYTARQSEPSSGHERSASEYEEEAWELDEAQDDLIGVPRNGDMDNPTDPGTLADTFISRLPPSIPTSAFSKEKLPFPIIIPQRRPKDRSRGMVRAYPLILEQRGIDQAMFIDFIETFNKSTQATKWIAALNLASIGTMWLPTVTGLLVSMAITAATTAAMEVQGRYRTNIFLHKTNEQFFMPTGLFCLVVTWNPDNPDAQATVDFESMARKVMSGSSGQFMSSLRSSNGRTHGEFQWPEVAPLIYPGLDTLAATSDEEGKAKRSSWKKKRVFVEDYMDRRAQAKFAMDNPKSTLAAGPKPKFSSRFADPSHPANSGSLVALISGGAVQMPERGNMMGSPSGGSFGDRDVRGTERFGRRSIGGFGREFGSRFDRAGGDRSDSSMVGSQPVRSNNDSKASERGLGGICGGRGGANAGPLGFVQKVMKKDVLYLLVVDMPSDAELAEAHETASELLSIQRSH